MADSHDDLHESLAELIATLQSAIETHSDTFGAHTETLKTLALMVDLIAKASKQQSADLQEIKATLVGVVEALKPGSRH